MKKTAILIGITTFGVVSIAQAAALPRYDPGQYCDRIADLSGGSATLANECIKMEQRSYNKLKNMWESIPEKIVAYCDRLASTTGGSYTLLESCIDMEMTESNSPQKFEF